MSLNKGAYSKVPLRREPPGAFNDIIGLKKNVTQTGPSEDTRCKDVSALYCVVSAGIKEPSFFDKWTVVLAHRNTRMEQDEFSWP